MIISNTYTAAQKFSIRKICNVFLRESLLLKVGMCNSDRVLEYLAVTTMIDHKNDDRKKKKTIFSKQHFV